MDGFFTTLPEDAIAPLRRDKNGQPALILYPYGQGWVIATTMYEDWGRSNYQGSRDARTLVRDIISWAMAPAPLPEVRPGEPVSVTLPLTNVSGSDAAAVQLTLLDPDKNVVEQQTRPLAIPAGGSTAIDFETTAGEALGIWWVDYALLDAAGEEVQPSLGAARFVVSNPDALIAPDRDLSLSITAPTEYFINGSRAEYTIHTYNHSDTPRAVEVRYGFGGHPEAFVYGQGDFFTHTLTIPAQGEERIVFRPIMINLWSDLYGFSAALLEDGRLVDLAVFAAYRVSPSASVEPQTDREVYSATDEVVLRIDVTNEERVNLEAFLHLQVSDPADRSVYRATLPLTVPAAVSTAAWLTFTLPPTSTYGFYQVQAIFSVDETPTTRGYGIISSGNDRFELPPASLVITPDRPSALIPGISQTFPFTLTNAGPGDVVSGTLDVVLKDSLGTSLWAAARSLDLPAGESATLNFEIPLPVGFDRYVLDYQAQYGGRSVRGTLDLPSSEAVALSFDKTAYGGGDQMHLELALVNEGVFSHTLGVSLTVPSAAYSTVWALTLTPGQSTTLPCTVTLPVTITGSVYPIAVTLNLGPSQQAYEFHFVVLPADLQWTLDEPEHASRITHHAPHNPKSEIRNRVLPSASTSPTSAAAKRPTTPRPPCTARPGCSWRRRPRPARWQRGKRLP